MGRRTPRPASQAFREVRGAVAPKTRLAQVELIWRETLGEQIAANAWPLRERDGVLTVGCGSAIWAEELNLMQAHVLERLAEHLGEAAPSALRFQVAEGPLRPPG